MMTRDRTRHSYRDTRLDPETEQAREIHQEKRLEHSRTHQGSTKPTVTTWVRTQ